jgi:hypothetical protein
MPLVADIPSIIRSKREGAAERQGPRILPKGAPPAYSVLWSGAVFRNLYQGVRDFFLSPRGEEDEDLFSILGKVLKTSLEVFPGQFARLTAHPYAEDKGDREGDDDGCDILYQP